MLTAQKDMANTQRLGQVEQTNNPSTNSTGNRSAYLINAQTTTESKQCFVEANKLMVDAQRNTLTVRHLKSYSALDAQTGLTNAQTNQVTKQVDQLVNDCLKTLILDEQVKLTTAQVSQANAQTGQINSRRL